MTLRSERTAATALVLLGVVLAPLGVVQASRGGEVHRLLLAWPVFVVLGLALRGLPDEGEHKGPARGTKKMVTILGALIAGTLLMVAWEWALIVVLGSRFRS